MKREPAEPQGFIKLTGVGIPRLQAGEDVKEETWDLSDPADPLNIGMGWGTGGHGLGL